MKMTIQTPHLKARPSLLDFMLGKVGKLEVISDKIIESQIFLKLDKSRSKENKVCEITLLIPGRKLFASSKSKSFEEAVVKATTAARSQIKRWKRLRKFKHLNQ